MFKFTKEEQALERVNQLDYIAWLLEHMCWAASPGRMTLDEFRQHLKDNYDAV